MECFGLYRLVRFVEEIIQFKEQMRIAIMQPGYLPWLGFFELMHNCDVFVLFDDVQYTKKDWRSRNRIRTKDGWMWLSVPIQTKHNRCQMISEARIDHSSNWRHKHVKAVEINYRKARFFKDYFAAFKEILSFEWTHLCDLDFELIKWLSEAIGIRRKIIRSSVLKTGGKREEKIISVCKALGAGVLYDSKAAASFLDAHEFDRHGIRMIFQDYAHPVYEQVHSPFMSFMSTVDLLFNCGPLSGDIILGRSVVNDQESI